MRGFVEFINRDTGEPVSIPASHVRLFKSRDAEGDEQITSILYSGIEVDITDTYDEFCYKMKEAGYKVLFSTEYNPDK